MDNTYIQSLFDRINGGDCVDSAAQAQELCEELLEACKALDNAMDVPHPLNLNDALSVANALFLVRDVIAKAEGRS
jgi:hypothetical protein